MLIRDTEKEARTLYARAMFGFIACCFMAATLGVAWATWSALGDAETVIVVIMNAAGLILDGRFVVSVLRRGSRA